MILLFLIIPACAAQDNNSTSTGIIEWEDGIVYVGDTVKFNSSAVCEINSDYDVQNYFILDDNGYVAALNYSHDIDGDTKYYVFDHEWNEDASSFLFTESGTNTLYLYEYYEFWNETVGATEWHTKLLDSNKIVIVERQSSENSDKNDIWTKIYTFFNF